MSQVKLWSYGGEWVHASELREPADETELVRAFSDAAQAGKRVTLRCGANAFDTQSLNDSVVVSMRAFNRLSFDPASGVVTAGAAVTWKQVLDLIVPQGFVPYIAVTSSTASVGGTVSSDSLSRFTPTVGREGNYVDELRVVPFDGAPFVCSPSVRPDDFDAIVGGLGYLGAITEVKFRAHRLPFTGRPLVRTDFHIVRDLNTLDVALVDRMRVAQQSYPGEPIAVAATAYLGRKLRRGAVMTSRYVDSNTVPANHPQSFLFRPTHVLHLLTQSLFLAPALRPLLWWIAFKTFLRKDNTTWDTLEGWTFFQDGNARVKGWGRKLGISMGTRQQTFVVPFDLAQAGPGADPLSRFLTEADRIFDSVAKQVPALIDILYIPKEAGSVPVLCATRTGGGFAVTFAFETSLARRLRRVEQAMRQVSERLWVDFGGRVHLVKHVFADAALLEQMYDWQALQARKQVHDPRALLKNAFLGKVFPRI